MQPQPRIGALSQEGLERLLKAVAYDGFSELTVQEFTAAAVAVDEVRRNRRHLAEGAKMCDCTAHRLLKGSEVG